MHRKAIEGSAKILIIAIALILLYLSSLYNYLLFHSIVEITSVCIALTVFFITWNSRNFIKNNYLIMVGTAYLFIGLLDFFHTISYKGMTIFADYDYYANQLWIAARYFESLVLLISFLMISSKKKIDTFILFTIYAVLSTAIMLSIFVWKIFPVCYIEGTGLTPFKKISEYIISAILLAAIYFLTKNKQLFDKKVYVFLIISLTCTVFSELSFTTYLSNYGFTNLLGHYFKIISFYCIYRSIILTGIQEPYNLIFRELKQNEQQLYEQNSILSHQAVADGLTIRQYVDQLQQHNKTLNRQAKLLDLSHEAIFAWNMDGPIIYWNNGAEKMYGFTDNEAIGLIPYKLLNSRFSFSYDELKSVLLENGSWSGYVEHTTKGGQVLIIDTRMQIIISETGQNTVLETNRDVTDRIKAENEINKITMELKNIINSTEDFIWSVDAGYRIIFSNRSVRDFTKKYYGIEFEPGSTFADIFPPENASSFNELFERAREEGEFQLDIHSFRGDRYISYSFHPLFVDSELVEITVFGRDITERIKAEQEIIKLNASLEARVNERTEELKQSLETIRTFALMVTHDLKTPLHEIEKLSDKIRNNIDIKESSEKISDLCSFMNRMITELLEHERIINTDIKKKHVDIGKIIVSVFEEMKTDNTVLDFQTGLPEVYADPDLIKHVVMNLMSNAIKFSSDRDVPRIFVGCKRESNEYVFYIKDNGIGIEMEYAGRLFNLFERLHGSEKFKGYGIGLASVRSIISKHGGRTWISGKVNFGTTVYFTLPIGSDED